MTQGIEVDYILPVLPLAEVEWARKNRNESIMNTDFVSVYVTLYLQNIKLKAKYYYNTFTAKFCNALHSTL